RRRPPREGRARGRAPGAPCTATAARTWPWRLPSSARRLLVCVTAEGPGRGELAQLVAHHRLGDVDRDVLATVVDGDRVPDHLGDDRGATRPGPDHALLPGAIQVVHLLG